MFDLVAWLLRARAWVISASVAAILCGCASDPDMRAVVFKAYGPDAVVLTPPKGMPAGISKHYANNFVFVPGAIVKPDVRNKVEPGALRSEEWNVAGPDYCSHAPSHFTLMDTGPVDADSIHFECGFEASLPFLPINLCQPGYMRREFGLKHTELKRLRWFRVSLTNVRRYEATTLQLQAATRSIVDKRDCRNLARSRRAKQVVAIHQADIVIEADQYDGAGLDLAILYAGVKRHMSIRQSGRGMFFAVTAARPIL